MALIENILNYIKKNMVFNNISNMTSDRQNYYFELLKMNSGTLTKYFSNEKLNTHQVIVNSLYYRYNNYFINTIIKDLTTLASSGFRICAINSKEQKEINNIVENMGLNCIIKNIYDMLITTDNVVLFWKKMSENIINAKVLPTDQVYIINNYFFNENKHRLENYSVLYKADNYLTNIIVIIF